MLPPQRYAFRGTCPSVHILPGKLQASLTFGIASPELSVTRPVGPASLQLELAQPIERISVAGSLPPGIGLRSIRDPNPTVSRSVVFIWHYRAIFHSTRTKHFDEKEYSILNKAWLSLGRLNGC
jgi:hypothetical protein